MDAPPDWFSSPWVEAFAGNFAKVEHITLGEMRGNLKIQEALALNPHAYDKRHLTLSDNAGVVGSLTKGRSPSVPLNRLLRKSMALQLAVNMFFSIAWISTRFCPADSLSRRKRERGRFRPDWL